MGEKRRPKSGSRTDILKELEKNKSQTSFDSPLSPQEEEGKQTRVRVRSTGREKRVEQEKKRRVGRESDRDSGRDSDWTTASEGYSGKDSERWSAREGNSGRDSERGTEREGEKGDSTEEGEMNFFSFHESMNPSGSKSPYSIQKLNGLIDKEVSFFFFFFFFFFFLCVCVCMCVCVCI